MLSRKEYNSIYGDYFETDPLKIEYDTSISAIIAYADGAHIEMCSDHDGKAYFRMEIMNSHYKSGDLEQLEERLWDDFVKFEHANLCREEVKEDYRERIMDIHKGDMTSFVKAHDLFNKLLETS